MVAGRGWLPLLLGMILAVAGVSGAHAERRVALVIGNGHYGGLLELPNPLNDAPDVAAALTKLGFEVIEKTDLDKRGMDRAFGEFAQKAAGADAALFYYSGHAMELEGRNYLIPIGAKLESEADVPYETARVDDVIAELQRASGVRMVILDSCRDNPLADELKQRSARVRGTTATRGLAAIRGAEGMLVAFSTQAGRTAADGSERNSPFTAAFLHHVETPSLEVGQLFRRVAKDVSDNTRGEQLPELSISLLGEFFFNAAAPVQDPAVGAVAAPVTPAAPVDREALFWESIKSSTNPADFEEYLRQFPNGVFAGLARNRIEGLPRPAQQQVAAVEPVAVPSQERQRPGQEQAGDTCPHLLVASAGEAVVLPANTPDRCLAPGTAFRDCPDCPDMVVVPAGSFTMGSPASEEGRLDSEGPQHEVRIADNFAVGRFEVTRGQFAAFVAATGHDTGSKCWTFERGEWKDRSGRLWRKPGFDQDDTHPVACVNWDDAKAYVEWLADKTGVSYRLLTEAEWEYSARAATSTRFWFGTRETDICANGNGLDSETKKRIRGVSWEAAPCDDGQRYTAPVGSFTANSFGLYDMAGNVLEWTGDCWNDSYQGAPDDGSAWTSGDCSTHVLRGGSWFDGSLHSASRTGHYSGIRSFDSGLRVARTLAP